MRRALLLLLAGCGAAGPTSGTDESTMVDDSAAEDSLADDVVANDTVADPEAEPSETAVVEESLPCAERDWMACDPEAGCVPLPGGSCREATHECELLTLQPRGEPPVFDRGDPCERANPECAWNPATRRCALFAAVPSCPASAEAAAQATVLCNHSNQPALNCSYPGTECACRRPQYCGGARPTAAQEHPSTDFACIPDFDDRGCPTRSVREGSRCQVAPEVQCHVSCHSMYTCTRGRWRRHRLPPRP